MCQLTHAATVSLAHNVCRSRWLVMSTVVRLTCAHTHSRTFVGSERETRERANEQRWLVYGERVCVCTRTLSQQPCHDRRHRETEREAWSSSVPLTKQETHTHTCTERESFRFYTHRATHTVHINSTNTAVFLFLHEHSSSRRRIRASPRSFSLSLFRLKPYTLPHLLLSHSVHVKDSSSISLCVSACVQ